jgi:vacuolar protein sorting-associated protein 13A/C
LYPTILPKEGKPDNGIKPTLQLALVRLKDASHGVDYYKYFTLLLQEMSVDFDEAFLYKLLDFFKFQVAGRKYDEG